MHLFITTPGTCLDSSDDEEDDRPNIIDATGYIVPGKKEEHMERTWYADVPSDSVRQNYYYFMVQETTLLSFWYVERICHPLGYIWYCRLELGQFCAL